MKISTQITKYLRIACDDTRSAFSGLVYQEREIGFIYGCACTQMTSQ